MGFQVLECETNVEATLFEGGVKVSLKRRPHLRFLLT